MTARSNSWLDRRFKAWLMRRLPARDRVTLDRRNIYILPSRHGLMFLLAASLIFIAAINYAVSLAFGLAFFMVSVFVLAILYSFRNLNRLRLNKQPSAPVFVGEEIAFNILLSRDSERRHEALELSLAEGNISHADLTTLDRQQVQVFCTASRRGEFPAPRLKVLSRYPLGLCRAWSVLSLNLHCLVYPRPVSFDMSQFHGEGSGGDDHSNLRPGNEEFYSLRDYNPGDPLRQVSWKHVARGQGMLVKQFVDYVDERVWLDWDMFYGFGTEERLSRLCYAVLEMSRAGRVFGLKLPGGELAPGSGGGHRNRALRMLALFDSGAGQGEG